MGIQISENNVRIAGSKEQFGAIGKSGQYGFVSYSIKHTRVSWALDIEHVISNHLHLIFIKETKIEKVLSKLYLPLNFALTLTAWFVASNYLIDSVFSNLVERADESAGSQIDLLLNILQSGATAKYIAVALVVSIFTLIIVSGLVDKFFRV